MDKQPSLYRVQGLYSLIYNKAPIEIRYRAMKLLFCGKYGVHAL
jgi:hypothetical protein